MLLPPLGAPADALDTPALCLDLDVFEANARRVGGACRAHGVGWRPHAKGHKSPLVARWLLEAGALGATCAKLGEAEVLAAGGIRDLLIANLIVGPHKLARLQALRRIADPIVCVDHADQVAQLSAAFAGEPAPLRVILEVDIGLHRAGVAPGAPAVALARRVAAAPGLSFSGIMGYEGHLLTIADQEQKAREIAAALRLLVQTRSELADASLPCPIVSCAGTGSYVHALACPGITEVQAGGAVFMDAFYREQCQVRDLDYALTVVATVVSRPAPERAVIDAGRKTMNVEFQKALVLDRPGVTVGRLSAEHCELALAPDAHSLKIGDRLRIVPGYADLSVNLHDELYGFRGGKLERVIPIAARGRVQ